MCLQPRVLHNAQHPLEYDGPTLVCKSDVLDCLKLVCVQWNRSPNPFG